MLAPRGEYDRLLFAEILCVFSCVFHVFFILLLWAKLPELNVMSLHPLYYGVTETTN